MRLDNPAWASFNPLLNVKLVESNDEPGERFFIYFTDDGPPHMIDELQKVGRFLHRQYLSEIPFVLVFSDKDCESMHIGWNSWLPHVEEWSNLMTSEYQDIVLLNELAVTLLSEKSDEDSNKGPAGIICDLSEIQELHSSLNIYLFFVKI